LLDPNFLDLRLRTGHDHSMPISIKSFLDTVRRSFKTEHHDFTKEPIASAVILLAIPMILELTLEGVFAIVDMFFVGRLGQNAIATVGLAESVVTIVYSIAIGLSTGATAIVSRRIGEKNPEAAARASAQALMLSTVIACIVGGLGVTYAKEILEGMGAAPEVVASGTTFTKILLGSSPVIVLLFLINGIFRGAGDAAMAMRSLWIASGVNILLCPVLIHFFGLKGAAIATAIGRGSGVLYQVRHLIRGDGELRLRARDFALRVPIIKSIASIAWPASLQYIIGSGSWIVVTRLVAETGGTAASAGYQIAFRNFIFFILPAWGLSNAAATLVGQNLGAKQFERAEESALTTAKYSAAMMTVFTFIFVFLSPLLVHIFTDDVEVARYGVEAIRGIGLGFVFYGVGMVMTQALNGAGATRTPTWINIFCFWIFQTPLAYFIAKGTDLGAHAIIYVIPAAHGVLAVMAWYVFKLGRWKQIKV
jgi:putative MATE family efflux protein